MTRNAKVGILTIGLLMTSPAPAPTIVGNGGDAVWCRPSGDQGQVHGMHFLDYLFEQPSFAGAMDAEILVTMQMKIHNNLPHIAADFDDFLSHRFHFDEAAKYRWMADPNVPDIDDEDIDWASIRDWFDDQGHPWHPNCFENDGALDLRQAVVRSSGVHHVDFVYDVAVIRDLERTPGQLPLLLLHEFFHGYLHGSENVRRAIKYVALTTDARSLQFLLANVGFRDEVTGSGQTRSVRVLAGRSEVQQLGAEYLYPEIDTKLIIFSDLDRELFLRHRTSAITLLSVPPRGDAVYFQPREGDAMALYDSQDRLVAEISF